MLQKWYLIARGYPPVVLKIEDRGKYYRFLRARQGVLDAAKSGKTWYSTRRAIEQYLSEHGKQHT